MFKKDVDTLHRYVEKFKKYQQRYYPQITEENDNGEWEIGAKYWEEMNTPFF